MTTTEAMKGYLNFLTYAAQFDHPMVEGVDKVFSNLIEPKLPFVAPKEFLACILMALSIDGPLNEMAPSTKGHSDKEIREFLNCLAQEIEARYGNAIRSGGVATQLGKWRCVEDPKQTVMVQKDEMLPDIDGRCVVWEFESESPKLNSEEAILQEFRVFYQRKTIEGAPFYKDPKKYAEASGLRLLKHLEGPEISATVSLLKTMSQNPKHPVIHAIEVGTSYDWTSEEENWEWFQKLTNQIADQIK